MFLTAKYLTEKLVALFINLNKKIKLSLKLAPVSTVVVHSASTSVNVTDGELNELLEVVYNEIGNSNQISITLLQSLGLDTPTVIEYLQNLGYLIF